MSLLYPNTDGASGPTEGSAEAGQQGKQGKHGQRKMAQLEGTRTTVMGQGAVDAPGKAGTPSLQAFPILCSLPFPLGGTLSNCQKTLAFLSIL